ncbi:MAG: phosphoglycerate dehydrogenase [Chloroflexi bacterium]|nr:phosphoglycerate dehydrogenase [Chloroflexota bacterium]
MRSLLITAPGVTGPDDPRLQRLRDAGWRIRTHRWPGGRPPEEEVIELVQGNDAVIASAAERYTRAVIERADTLKHIARWGVGYETVDVAAATDNGVLVTTTVGSNHWAVADHAFALMLAVARRVVELDKIARTRQWSRPHSRDVWQKTLGIIGLGRIGKGVAQRASGFEMKVLAYEPYPDHEFCSRWNVELVSLDELFRRSDYVTVHAPGEGGNRHLVNADRLALMKPTAVFVNTARGVLVDEDALYAALTEHRIAGAGLDVREHEPPIDDRFEALSNVVLTPHTAGSTEEAQAASAVMVVDSLLQAADGEPPHGLMNPEVWEHRRG